MSELWNVGMSEYGGGEKYILKLKTTNNYFCFTAKS